MGAEEFLYRLDPRKLEIVSGDLKCGFWDLRGCTLHRSPELFNSKDTNQNLDPQDEVNLDRSIASLNIRSIKDANAAGNMVGIGVGALAGLRFFGPLGAVAGAIAGQAVVGNRHEVVLEILLQDGRHFVAKMDKAVYERIKVIVGRDFSKTEN